MRTEIRFAGVGGQGSILASTILAETAGVYGGMEAIQSANYEAAIRDGAAAGDIIIGDKAITFPWVLNPNYLIAQHQGAIRAHLDSVAPEAVVIADTVYVKEIPETAATVYHVPLTEIADSVGIRRVANMVALAVFARVSNLVEFDHLEQAVMDRSPFGSGPKNQEALRKGYELDLDEFRVSTPLAASN
jgi:2-oxoglutarate ferredoxin oxidoreductase subunit gamma